MFNIFRFPYSSFEQINLDWIMRKLAELSPQGSENPVSYDPQTPDATEQAQARANIGLGDIAVESAPLPVDKGGTGHDNAADVLDEFKIVSYDAQTLDPTDAAQARTNLGLGGLAVEDAPLAVAKGGTGAIDKATAAMNLEAVSWGASQTLNGTQKTRARTNLGINAPIYTELGIGVEEFTILANANSCDVSISNVPDGYSFITIIGGASIGFVCAPYFAEMNLSTTKAWVNVAPTANKTIRVFYLYGKTM